MEIVDTSAVSAATAKPDLTDATVATQTTASGAPSSNGRRTEEMVVYSDIAATPETPEVDEKLVAPTSRLAIAGKTKPAGGHTRQCKSKVHPNEDRYRIEDPLVGQHEDLPCSRYFAVFDGHGGHNCSAFLEKHMHERVRESNFFGLDYEKSLVDAVMSSEQQYHSLLHRDTGTCDQHVESSTDGSCAVVCLLVDDTLFVANVGDCRAVLSIDGHAKALTRDHKACDPAEKKRVLEAGGFVRGNRMFGLIAVTRSLGDFEYKLGDIEGTLIATPETYQEAITEAHDCLILGCDGVWDVLGNDIAVERVTAVLDQGADGSEAAKALVDLALERGSKDDITVVVVPLRPGRNPVSL